LPPLDTLSLDNMYAGVARSAGAPGGLQEALLCLTIRNSARGRMGSTLCAAPAAGDICVLVGRYMLVP
jgi:hypothetical protein